MSRYPKPSVLVLRKHQNKILGLCRNLQGRYLKFLNEYNGIQSKVNYTNVTANYSSTGVESSQLLTTL